MLILKRGRGEKVTIIVPRSTSETFIEVVMLETIGNSARLGFDAPESTMIHRQEVYEAIKAKKAAEE